MTMILHITPANYFRAQPDSAPYLPAAFGADGFIHCTQEPEVLLHIANNYYKNEKGDVLVLVIDPAKVKAEVKLEGPNPPPDPSSPVANVLFPHIYGPLNRDAIVEIRTAKRAADGTFLSV